MSPMEVHWAFNDTTMLIVGGVEATPQSSQAGFIQGHVGAHLVQRCDIAKTVLKDRFVHNGHALGLGEEEDKRWLPVGHEARVDVGFHSNGFERPLAVEADAIGCYRKLPTHTAQRI